MSDFSAKSLAILGRQPALGLAELESLYGADHIQSITEAALLDLPIEEIAFARLGGTIKLAQLLTVLPTADWQEVEKFLVEKVPEHLQYAPEGKFTLGLSAYGFRVNGRRVQATALSVKKAARAATGRSIRIVPNQTPELNTAQVLHNQLTRKGAWELLLVRDGRQTYVAQSYFVQDIEKYAARDQKRPQRDARVGMLPPKLAQIIVNFAAGNTPAHQNTVVLDPFCGTGVVLQEATLMGYGIYGTDLNPRMIEYTDKNLQWLRQTIATNLASHNHEGRYYQLEVGDASTHQWKPLPQIVASEVFLGTPMTSSLPEHKLNRLARPVNELLTKALKNMHSRFTPGTRLCLALPAWKIPNSKEYYHLLLLDHLQDLGYNRLQFVHARWQDLIYARDDQFVGRELVVLERI